MKNLFQKYMAWADTWTSTQLLFVFVIIVALGSAGIFAAHRFTCAHGVIQTLINTNQPSSTITNQ